MSALSRAAEIVSAIGIRGTLSYLGTERLLRHLPLGGAYKARKHTYLIRAREAQHPLVCRFDTSDRDAFGQIFVGREYACLDPSQAVKTIVDGGANVGYATAYFLNQFPQAHVIAIEPDDRNFEVLRRNAERYENRTTLLRSAVWSRRTGLKVHKGQFRDGREWATTVQECSGAETPDVEAIDIASLMAEHGLGYIDILKLDIEGAEKVVFSENYRDWIDKVGVFLIELHGDDCRETFLKALRFGQFEFYPSGELLVAERAGVREAWRLRAASEATRG